MPSTTPTRKKTTTAAKPAAGKTSGAKTAGAKSTVTKKTGAKSGRTTKTTGRAPRRPARAVDVNAAGKNLVIVESPAKAKTINQYLGGDFVVAASVGHVRDLPSKAPKGSKQPVPGVDLEHRFNPTYEILPDKKLVVSSLKKAAKEAREVWFATDMDREGEAIAWHLAQELGIEPGDAKRVVFNAITRAEIQKAFQHPKPIDEFKVNAQQARRILDRIVGYQVSPLLWKKVARGLSAGRVQSVAVRLIVDREREIDAFIPEEYWKITGYFTVDIKRAPELRNAWAKWIEDTAKRKQKEKGVGDEASIREKNAWLNEHQSISGELFKIDGEKFEPKKATEAIKGLELAGFTVREQMVDKDPKAKGPAKNRVTLIGELSGNQPDWRVKSMTTKRTKSRPYPPYITSTLQQAASNVLGFGAQQTMRVAQQLYEGIDIKGIGTLGLITYMRTDSTHISNDAINTVRKFIGVKFGKKYLPDDPNYYKAGKRAQEAHEAIRPTDVEINPSSPAVKAGLDDKQLKLYTLIWERFIACQMTPAEWDSTTIEFGATVNKHDVLFKTTGRTLVFDGFYKVAGVPRVSDELVLPELREQQELAALQIDPQQKFTSPPARYTEASLVKTLEAEGIGRPSTYASIINVIQDRKYVEQLERRFHATDLGEVVTDKLMEGFPRLMDLGYTRNMEEQLDKIEDAHTDWVTMLEEFYGRFSAALELAHENLSHAKAELEPAPYACPTCGRQTCYRFGKNGRFLSCTGYPDCNYAAPINRAGEAMLPERVNIRCPEDGSEMVLRTGRFGKFIASPNYPDVKYVLNLDKKGQLKLPQPPPLETDLKCEKCESAMYLRRGKRGPWLGCSTFPKCRGRMAWTKIEDEKKKAMEMALEQHERANPMPTITTLEGKPIAEGTKVEELIIPGGVQKLKIHPEAAKPSESAASAA